MNRRTFLSLFTMIAALLAGVSSAWAQDVAGAKTRMRERVPTLDQLKLAEAIGESNRGYVEVRKPDGNAAAVADAENKDRAVVFQDTAARTGSTADAVGRAFAKQVIAASAPGVWVQRDDGSWQKK